MKQKYLCLTIDTEEFDALLKWNDQVSEDDMMKPSEEGVRNLLNLFGKDKATFFVTASFARSSESVLI